MTAQPNLTRFLAISLLLLLALAGLVACAARQSAANGGPAVALEPCRLPAGVAARCGTLTVFENREAASGRTIDLRIAVIPATGSLPEAAPLFLLAGGPGQAASEAFPPLLELFTAINKERDLVLVDQRGTGQSNPLACENFTDASLTRPLSDEERVALTRQCLASLDADLTRYTTDVAMADLDDVRAALGYEQINLYGGSYGTRAALTYLRLYPERVRTVVLDAVVGPELVLFLQAPRDGQRALEMLFARCAADPACNEQFPDVEMEFQALLARLETPLEFAVAHPLSGEQLEVILTRDLFAQVIFNLLYSTDLTSLLPLLIHQAHQSGDFGPLVAQGLLLAGETGLYHGMLYSVTCAEDAPFIALEEAKAFQAGTIFPLMAEPFVQSCAEWPHGQAPAALHQPVVSSVPTLLLSGEADPITPPVYAAQVAESLPNSLHLVVPGYGHVVISVGCLPRLAADFIAQGTVEGLDATCLERLQPPPFFVDFAGPQP
ncbi:MAG: alpha/beta hydrolase [Chloroflexi bacterium]|nr:alpha/beta hydrolase [Chloroflexota bacterium]MCI0577378.1 alpha/beta hydrolase [Chloroflexota bacterium]MCI0647065.1 alpha/beta hydrolase [Chloroflexota bacterium]MCI0731552.1 alpha/beta hydrolase [Chloroflexota bacterium]